MWWVITFFQTAPGIDDLWVYANTNFADHLFMSWSFHKPARSPIMKNVRGVWVHCGYKYTWDTPHVAEQLFPGDTLTHSFYIWDLSPEATIWFYLWAPGGPGKAEIQGPLCHVTLEALMISARIYHSIDQVIPGLATTTLTFDSELWDTTYFHEGQPDPTRLVIPYDGLYIVGTCFRFATMVPAGVSAQIIRNGGQPIAYHSHYIDGNNWPGAGFSFHTLVELDQHDFLQVQAYHSIGGPRTIGADPNYSPHFWIARLGPKYT